jgi:hypothetical protein
VLALFTLLCCSTGQSYGADTLECPEIGQPRFLISSATLRGAGCSMTESPVDLANKINESINRLQIASPNISSTDVQNVLVAAYCRVVAHKSGHSGSEKWSGVREFDSALEQQTAANMPAGTLIIANIPLPPDVCRELRKQAAVSHQTTVQIDGGHPDTSGRTRSRSSSFAVCVPNSGALLEMPGHATTPLLHPDYFDINRPEPHSAPNKISRNYECQQPDPDGGRGAHNGPAIFSIRGLHHVTHRGSS